MVFSPENPTKVLWIGLSAKSLFALFCTLLMTSPLVAETAKSTAATARRLLCTNALKELGFMAGPRSPTQQGRELLVAKIDLMEPTPQSKTFSSEHLAALLEPIPPVLLPRPGQILVIETTLESNRGMIDSIFASLTTSRGESIGNLRFDAQGRFISGSSLISKPERASFDFFSDSQSFFSLISEPKVEHPFEALVPRSLIRPLLRKIHPLSPEDPQDLQVIFSIRRTIHSDGTEQVQLGLTKALLEGIMTDTGIAPILPNQEIAVRGLAWNHIPLFENEDTSSTIGLPRPHSFIHNSDPFSISEFEIAVHPRKARNEQGFEASVLFSVNYIENRDTQKQLVFDLEQDADGYHYQIYEEDLSIEMPPDSPPRASPRFRSVGFTNSRADSLFHPQEIIWIDSGAEEEFRLGIRPILREITLGVDSIRRPR